MRGSPARFTRTSNCRAGAARKVARNEERLKIAMPLVEETARARSGVDASFL
jgi:hypothetical protein